MELLHIFTLQFRQNFLDQKFPRKWIGYLVPNHIPLFIFWGYTKEYAYVSKLPSLYSGRTQAAVAQLYLPHLIYGLHFNTEIHLLMVL
jgi:hypothetical protein